MLWLKKRPFTGTFITIHFGCPCSFCVPQIPNLHRSIYPSIWFQPRHTTRPKTHTISTKFTALQPWPWPWQILERPDCHLHRDQPAGWSSRRFLGGELMSFYSLVFEAFIGCQQCIFFLLKLSGSHVIKVSSDFCGNFPFRILFNIFLNKI